MSFTAYPTYKDSGSEWIGAIPAHWSACPLKRAFKIEGGSTPPPDEANWDGDIAWITPADLSGLTSLFLETSKRTITATGFASCGTALLPAGSLILSTRAPIGSLAIALIDMCTNQGCKGLVPSANASASYFAFVLLTAKDELNNRGRGTTFLEISGDELSRFSVPTPPFAEQIQIARFLDHETARIDALIEEQQRLIELLKEKRRAVVSQAVTRGLDPTAPMKESGVEWLGEVPAHWEVTRVGWQCIVGNGCTPSRDNQRYWDNGHYPWLNSSKVNLERVLEADQFVTGQALKECALPIIKPGSVLMAITGEGKTRGMVTITEIEATINQHVAFIEPRGRSLTSTFLHDWLNANYSRLRHDSADWGSTKAAITCGDIRAYPLPLPPPDEQEKICHFIDSKSSLIGGLISTADENVKLLYERRSALISAAVTGKIDVRGWQPPASAESPELVKEAM